MPLSLGISGGAGFLKNPGEPKALGYRVNYIPNPTFEVDTTGWYAITNGSLAATTDDAFTGTQCLEVTMTGPTGAQYGAAAGGKIPLPGQSTYYASAYVKLKAGSTTANLSLRYFEYENVDSTSTVGNAILDLQQVSDTDGWVRLDGFWNSGPLANYVIIRVYNDSTTSGDVYYVDSVMLEESASLGTYFDGSQEGFWSGTAHDSFSGGTPY